MPSGDEDEPLQSVLSDQCGGKNSESNNIWFCKKSHKNIKIKVHQCFFYESKKVIHQFGAGISHVKEQCQSPLAL